MPSGLLPYQKEGWRPHQYEFSRLNMQYTVLSKRKLITLVSQKHVESWDDPRLPTISALRRRGFPASAVRLFADRVGISKAENNIDISVLEDCAREVLDEAAPRLFAVTNPLKVTIMNWEKSEPEMFSVERHPKRPELGHRELPFTGSIYIDREDFFDTKSDQAGAGFPLSPPKGYKRLLPQGQVRLKNAYVITCQEVVRDASGEVQELRCTYEPASRAGANAPGAAKVKGIIQWVSQATAVPVDLYLYDRLFLTPSPGKAQPDGDFLQDLNPHSLQIVRGAMVEPSVLRSLQEVSEDAVVLPGSGMAPGTFQFERVGYFALDTKASVTAAAAESGMRPRFNRVVTLKDTWQNAFAGADEGNAVAGHARAQNPASAAGGTGNPASTAAGVTAPVIEDVRRVELRVGEILSAVQHPDADTLYLLQVRVGDAAVSDAGAAGDGQGEAPAAVRTIISGLAGRIPLDSLPGRKVVVVCNLKPSKMRGIVSEGMLLAASAAGEAEGAERVELLAPPPGAHVGELIRVSGYDVPVPDAVLKSKTAQEVWKRVAWELGTDAKGQAGYGKGGSLLVTSAGPCTVPSLANARIS
jgi:tRNA-binding EMAP/Myf-like protein